MKVEMSNFALRHFKKNSGTEITNSSPVDFIGDLDSVIKSWKKGENSVFYDLQDSLYPFCKYLIVKNFTDAKSSSFPITIENYQYLRSGYSARREGELPYLSRWFEFPIKNTKEAEFLVLILYSREQLLKEHEGEEEFEISESADYGVVALQALEVPVVELMTPYTMVRNSLGIKWGGNGEEVNEEYIRKASEYWSTNAIIKQN